MTGLRIAHAEMLRIVHQLPSGCRIYRRAAGCARSGRTRSPGIEERAGRFNDLLVAVQALGDDDAAIGDAADPDGAALHRVVRCRRP